MPGTERTALVTGGGQGIGEAIARALGETGCRVVVTARSGEKVESVAQRLRGLGQRVSARRADVTQPESVRTLAKDVLAEFGSIDILVNNAGSASSAPFAKLRLEEWNRLLLVNATGTFLVTQAFLPGMAQRGWGRVVNIASVAGLTGSKYIAAYAASKHAVIGLTRSLAVEYAASGVTVNAVCPGYVDTPLTDNSLAHISAQTGRSREEALEAILANSPQRRLITPAEVAHTVGYLCSDAAHGINGQAIVVDGGGLLY